MHLVIPHYYSQDWLRRCIESHRELARSQFSITVVDTSDNADDHADFRQNFMDVNVIYFPVNLKGGGSLFYSLPFCQNLATKDGIGVVSDVDVVMLRRNWDLETQRLLAEYECIAINPRSDEKEFQNTPEWNWFATRRGICYSFNINGRHDWGHVIKDEASSYYLFQLESRPVAGKLASFVRDVNGRWCFHAFYSSMKHRNMIPGEVGPLTNDEKSRILASL